jgi:hypothetical protein
MQLKQSSRWKHGGDPRALGVTDLDYYGLTRFLPRAEALGLEATSFGKGPLNGCVLKLHGRNHDYELLVDGTGFMTLGRIQNSQRTRLLAASVNTEAAWDRVVATLKASEEKAVTA